MYGGHAYHESDASALKGLQSAPQKLHPFLSPVTHLSFFPPRVLPDPQGT